MPGSKVLSPGQSLEVDVQKCNMFLLANREILWNPLKSWVYLEMLQAVAYRCRVGIQTYEDRWSVAACFNSSVDLCCVGVDTWMPKRSHTCMPGILFGILQHIALSIKYDTVWLPAITHPDHGPHIDSCWHKRWTRKRSNTSTVEPSDIQHLRFLPSWDVRICGVCFPVISRNAATANGAWFTIDSPLTCALATGSLWHKSVKNDPMKKFQ